MADDNRPPAPPDDPARAAASRWSVTFVSKELWTVTFETDRSYRNNRALRVSVVLTNVSDAKTKVQLTSLPQAAAPLSSGIGSRTPTGWTSTGPGRFLTFDIPEIGGIWRRSIGQVRAAENRIV